MNDDALAAAGEMAAIFEDLNVPYMIGGSMASTFWGEPRFTLDVDFVAALKNEHVPHLLKTLGDAWYSDEASIHDAIERRSSFNLIRMERMVKVDVFVPVDSGLDASKWKRIKRVVIDPESPREICVTSPEDILLQKLDWYRRGGFVSENQWRDVTALLRIQLGHLDEGYLDTWAAKMNLAELLERARASL